MKNDSPVPIDFVWYHAVNDQSKLDSSLESIRQHLSKKNHEEQSRESSCRIIHAIEADIIYSEPKDQAVMGHPPAVDGELTLTSFLEQLKRAHFQQSTSMGTGDDANHAKIRSESHVLKLDFKSMKALQTNLSHVKEYVDDLPTCLREKVWINADILSGPGEDLNDEHAKLRVKPKFCEKEFLDVVISNFLGTTLSIGWTTSTADEYAVYTDEMVNKMLQCLGCYRKEDLQVTFPIRATSFRQSWGVLRKLYEANENWTVTLWWSVSALPEDEMDWIFETLEMGDDLFKNRTYYDMIGFGSYLLLKRNNMKC
mmetsp:Transcript_14319/g.30067  ORF Transcript_14319/g.30067 Transcript_14319/m.30067 type:complete len:312 (-) Transcript_14319:42-977(-)|eukprot:CAMPEP_0171379584 /NCGR_PEP_ID=MMETSP0879-20121228/27067_1 /TAXON_ID=67004 /ORGANISM="Thalassiosira weissflogii, Strain CCMP1336" /LENGTH=311 /DNA_ID=CAMNT_0011890409 /DNA_START=17 /DNA_END=952 /DNA_ORIENTATION=+